MSAQLAVIVLAAGKGTRMRSRLPKVMHRIAGQPMIAHALAACQPLSPTLAAVVVAPGMDSVREAAGKIVPACRFAVQEEQKGTGHAVACGMEALRDFDGNVLVVYGDTPLLSPPSLARLMEAKREAGAAVALLGMQPDDPAGYGRLVMKEPPHVSRIVECKDATPEEKKIGWVWGGVMAFSADFLREGLAALKPSPATGEYYLTALLEIADAKGLRSVNVPMPVAEAMGVNTRAQLAEAEALMQTRLRLRAMENGATLVDPATVFFSADTQLGEDVTVHPFVTFGPGVSVAAGAEIRSFCHLEGAAVGEACVIGPYARLRPGTALSAHAHVGNFVELKNTRMGEGAKANHLAYVGDAEVGAAANIGAGTITCNYDGVNKHKTSIGEGAFIGSNSTLVAPLSIGGGAFVAAGSTLTEDVPDGALAFGRARQETKPGAAEGKLTGRKKRN